jgi:tight adherence protein C
MSLDVSTVALAVPIFFIAYSGMGMMLDTKRRSGYAFGQRHPSAATRSLQEFTRHIGEMGFNQAILRIKGFRERLDRLLLHSGHPFEWKAEDLLFYKEFLLIVALFFVWQSSMRGLFSTLLGAAAGFWLPDILLQIRGTGRKTIMHKQLPGLVDLMALTVESGLDLIVAIERIEEHIPRGPLRSELQVMMQESRLGASRKDILQHWAYRVELPDVQSLTSLIIQSEEMGTPLAGVLRSFAEDMRSRRILRAEEIAGKIPVKILFPMMVFFFPIVFVIILGPVALDFIKNST